MPSPGKKVLFILKKHCNYGRHDHKYHCHPSGLFNSVQFMVDFLVSEGHTAKVVEVTDGNDIDREVHGYRPTHVFLEAIWCPPYKVVELVKLYPKISWNVRIHSDIPFLANEGLATSWLKGYVTPGVKLYANSDHAANALSMVGVPCRYLANWYPVNGLKATPQPSKKNTLDLGCFGAVRPFKNHLIQAMAAVAYADKNKKKLNFHVNATRVEQGGEQSLKNLRALFAGTVHELVEHDWLPRAEIIALMNKMDAVMIASLTETFSIVAADAVTLGIPLVASFAIPWARGKRVNPYHIKSIVNGLGRVLGIGKSMWIMLNRNGLTQWSDQARVQWLKEIA